MGNHDYGNYSNWKNSKLKKQNQASIQYFHKKIGFHLLCNASERISLDDDFSLVVAGVENWGLPPFPQRGDLQLALKDTDSSDFIILLSHDPSHWTEQVLEDGRADLTLSGHTHGMQAGIQYKNKQWSPIQYKYKHWAGLHREGNQWLYVNRGLGWLGFPGRIGMRPEITCIELT